MDRDPELISGRVPRVLVVDDQPMNLELMTDFVEMLGYESVSVRNGQDALDAIAQQEFDLVLLDVMMPVLDGMQTAAKIRERYSAADLPIIMVTALSSKEDRLKAVEAGANDFITKPVDRLELKIRASSQLKLKRLQDELKIYQTNLESLVDQRTHELRKALHEAELARENTVKAYVDTLHRLCIAAEFKDKETANHIRRMSRYSGVIARGLGMSEHEVELIELCSPLHDVGKIGIPDQILLKEGPLGPEEWKVMRSHTTLGARLLDGSSSELLQLGKVIALSHHEKWDGSGYPGGLAGEDIPLVGRICAVADVYDALTSERPYKVAMSNEKAVSFLRKGSGKHFDPQIVEVFIAHLNEVIAIQEEYN